MQDSSALIQAVCAVATLVLAIVVALQSTRIKTLTDIVASLDKQAQVWQQIYRFEVKSRLGEAQPVFISHSVISDGKDYTVLIKNAGQRARFVSFLAIENVQDIARQTPSTTIQENGVLKFIFTLKQSSAYYTIDLHFTDNHSSQYKQTISGKKRMIILEPPEEIIAEI
jgi:hypothetical protein